MVAAGININEEGGASASPSGVNGARPRALFNPNLYRLDAAARASQQSREAALSLAQAGLYIFPCKPDKTPLDSLKWPAESTTSTAKIEMWWARHPGAIPAIDCARNRIVALDLDQHGDGPDGVAAGEALLGDLYVLGAPITNTRNDGKHIYFAAPPGEPIGNSTGALPSAIDVRSRGYVVAPGATLPDGTGWASDPNAPDLAEAFAAGTIPELPAHVLDLIRTRPERPEPPRQRAGDGPQTIGGDISERERAFAHAALDACCAELAGTGAGARNQALNGASFRMGRQVSAGRIRRSEVERQLEVAADACGLVKDDGWPSVRASLRSGLEAGLRQPADPLADRERPNSRSEREDIRFTERDHPDEQRPRPTIVVDGILIDAETGEIIQEAADAQQDATGDDANDSQANGAGQHPRGPRVELHTVNAASLAGKAVPKQEWLVEDMIPANNVTLLSGDGGTGKSLLSLQLAVAVATGGSWIGYRPLQGPAVFLSAEDEIDELHRRLARIEPTLERLSALTNVPLAGEDSFLASPQGRDRLIQPTALFKAVKHVVAIHNPTLLVLDTAADLFSGNENARSEVRTFISMLRAVCIKQHVTIVLLSHPSQTGLASGNGDSGSTSWNNSVRSRLYFSRRIVDRVEDDVDLRVLEQKKSNRSRTGGQITVRWKLGRFVREAESALNARDAAAKASNIFLALLALFASHDRAVSDRRSPSFAPAVFAKHPDAEGTTKAQFEKAMDRLFRDGLIAVEEVGPPSRRYRRIVATAAAPQPMQQGEGATEEQSEEDGADDG